MPGPYGVTRGDLLVQNSLGWWAVGAAGERRGVGWSAAYLLTSRVSTLAAVPVLLSGLGVDLYAVWVWSILAGPRLWSDALRSGRPTGRAAQS